MENTGFRSVVVDGQTIELPQELQGLAPNEISETLTSMGIDLSGTQGVANPSDATVLEFQAPRGQNGTL